MNQDKWVVSIRIHDTLIGAGAYWDLFTQALTYVKTSMLQLKPKEALAILNNSYDLKLQMRPYELINS